MPVMSSGLAKRFGGMRSRMRSLTWSGTFASMSVSTNPGATQLCRR